MNGKFRIVIYCMNIDLCKLLEKYFQKSVYYCICIKIGIDYFNINNNVKEDIEPDCVIIDDTISSERKKLITEKHYGIPVLYIPALTDDSDSFMEKKIYISEPFKISELDKSLKELYDKKMQK